MNSRIKNNKFISHPDIKNVKSSIRGFALVELLVTIGIFAFMTALLMAKYGTFNQSVLMTNLAYDVALTIRTAQTFGLSIKAQNNSFQNVYGVRFSIAPDESNQIILFASPNDHIYEGDTEKVSSFTLKRGAIVSGLCVGDGPTSCTITSPIWLDISFKRPDPDAIICWADTDSICATRYKYAEITLKATDGSTRVVSVRKTGQVSVLE